MKMHLLAVAVTAAATAGAADAAVTLSKTNAQSGVVTGSNAFFSINPFDKSLGELQSVNINYTLKSTNSAKFTSYDFIGFSERMTATATGILSSSGTTFARASGSCLASGSASYGQTVTIKCDSYGDAGATLTSAKDLAIFLGSSPVTFNSAVSVSNTNRNLNVTASPTSTIIVSYSYVAAAAVAAVPEPATWATMAGGFAMIGAAARRRRRSLVAA